MHKFASFNHQILPSTDITVNAISSASLYGKGVFTTLAICNSQPFLWEKHWHRLNDNAIKVGIDLSNFSEHTVYKSLENIIEKNNALNARCRLTFFDESSSRIWETEGTDGISLLIQTAELREVKEHFSVTVSPFLINSTSPLSGVKSCNYLENVLALEDAKSKEFDEAIRLNERNQITSACMANVFWQTGGKLFTPSLKTGCLAGTIREFVLESKEVFEVEKGLEILDDTDVIFLTSTGIGICPVKLKNS